MSYGDEIMASGHALAKHRETGQRVRIADKAGRPRWSELWAGLPWIVQPGEAGEGAVMLKNGPQCRPYIRYPFSRERGCTYSGWRARDHVGEIRFTDGELVRAETLAQPLGRFVLIEPHVPPQSNPNKQWGLALWQALADILTAHGHRVAQFSFPGAPLLKSAAAIEAGSFRVAAAVLKHASGLVLPEGGLHHAAGVQRLPAVVLFGGAVDVNATGYPWHRNLADDGPGSPCGAWSPCRHCASIWARLTPQSVAAEVTEEIEARHG